ncbi:MAG TPA: hypothetical protein VFD12_08495 [Oligella sp.]|nr:hypothetical protein [Oligella sp.]
MNAYTLYQNLPVFFQNLLCSVYGFKESKSRYSKEFYAFLDEYKITDFNNKQSIHQAKTKKLKSILLSAKKSGLYSHLNQTSISKIQDDPWHIFSKLPILTKNDVRSFHEHIPSGRSLTSVITSGTTGKSLSFVKDAESIAAQWAIWFRHRHRFGTEFGDSSVNFTGKPVVPPRQSKPPYWRYNAAQKQYLISMQHINIENIDSIVGFLNTISPNFYSGYPSIIAEVARLAQLKGLSLDKVSTPSIIYTGAEKLLDYQQESIESWTGSTVTDQYGLSEGCCNFSKCEHGHYHEDFEFSHIEIADGETLEDGSVKGRLIGTGFFNHAMPFIRYDTGDIAVMAPEDFRCSCGRESRVIFSVDGRADDYVLTPDGRRVMRFDYLFKDTIEALEAQVVQEQPDSIIIKAVLSGQGTTETFEHKVRQHFDEFIATPMDLIFEYVDEIERTGTGKFKAVINRLDA